MKVTATVQLDPGYKREVRKATNWMLRLVLKAIVMEIRRVLSITYPPASRPGESPHRRTGTLRDSVASRLDATESIGWVSVDTPYASMLEDGTRKMKPRPYAMKSVNRVMSWVGKLFMAGRSES
jgi:hypothetical protein